MTFHRRIEGDANEIRVGSDAAGQQVVQDPAIHVIRHGAGRAHPALKRERVHVSEFLIAQQCRHAQCFDTGLDGVYVTDILGAEDIDVGCNALSDAVREGCVLDVGSQCHVLRVMLADFGVGDVVDSFDNCAEQCLRIGEDLL